MLKTIANAFLEGVRLVVGSVAIVVAAIWAKLSGTKGPYAVVPVLLAPMLFLKFLHLWGDRDF